MAVIEFNVGRSKYKIECPESQQTKLINLAQKLDDRVKESLSNFQNIDERTLLIINALTLQDELESLSYSNPKSDDDDVVVQKIDDTDMYAALTENIENITDYIEKLAKKIENY